MPMFLLSVTSRFEVWLHETLVFQEYGENPWKKIGVNLSYASLIEAKIASVMEEKDESGSQGESGHQA